MKKGLLLVNIGTPEAPTTEAVAKYLKAFLNDPLVIQMPSVLRKLLVNGIIVPQRAPKSAERYQKIWTKEGSPLLVHLQQLVTQLSEALSGQYEVFAGMRYGQPSIEQAINEIREAQIDELTVLPLYPHYTQSTTESTINHIKSLTKDKPKDFLNIVPPFYNKAPFINSIKAIVDNYDLNAYDHILFSYHSLPLKQANATSPKYDDVCQETTKLLAQSLGLKEEQYSTAFQSRLTKRWLGPYTSDVLKTLIKQEKTKVLVITPSFTADCLETILEIGVEYRDDFVAMGGKELHLVPCINSSQAWTEGIVELISKS